jgi:hypothetical protein
MGHGGAAVAGRSKSGELAMTKVTVIYSTKRGALDEPLAEAEAARVLSSMRQEHFRAIRVVWETQQAQVEWADEKKPPKHHEGYGRVKRMMRLAESRRG